MNKLSDEQKYLNGISRNRSHRQISKLDNWTESPALIRDQLLAKGLIAYSKTVFDPKSGKNHIYYKTTGKELSKRYEAFWDDGTPKSRGNAFDLSTARGLFNKAELASAVNKGKPNNYNTQVQVIAYSRA